MNVFLRTKFAIPSGFVKDLTVLTSNFSAEYGLTGSGVIDDTTFRFK
jgi:hypothetical protein